MPESQPNGPVPAIGVPPGITLQKDRAVAVSVVIPTFNYGRFLSEAIDSVLAQTYQDYEIIVVDGGSTDDTPEVVRAYGDRVRTILDPSPTPNRSRNTGVRASRGRFVALLDADDKWLPEKLAKQVALMEANPDVGLVYAGMLIFDSSSGAIVDSSRLFDRRRGDVLEQLFLGQFVPSPTPLIRREVFERVGLFDETNLGADDWDMWLRIAEKYRFDFVPEPLALYRLHPSAAGRRPLASYEADIDRFLRVSASRIARLTSLLDESRSRFSVYLAERLLHQGDVDEAKPRLIRAIRLRPSWLRPYLLLVYSSLWRRRIRTADWASARGAYAQARHFAACRCLKEARLSFWQCMEYSRFVWLLPVKGWLLTFAGRRLVSRLCSSNGWDIYASGPPILIERVSLEQW